MFAWLPELLWSNFKQPMCLTCGKCPLSNHGGYDFREVIGLHETYFVFSGRVKCVQCERNAHDIRVQADALTSEREREELKKSAPQYTFHTTDPEYLKSLPYDRGELSSCNRPKPFSGSILDGDGIGDFFPAVLSSRLGLDKSLMDLMLPLYDHSFNGNAFSKLLREMHSLKYAEAANAYLNLALQHMTTNTLTPVSLVNEFGSFFDSNGWCGHVPSSGYLNNMYKKLQAMYRPYYDLNLKMRGTGKKVKVDVSYKLPKRLHKKGGIANFAGLFTLVNEWEEVRSQFLIVSDAHEQIESQLKSLVETLEQYNQERPMLFHTDNPARDASLAQRVFKSSLLEPRKQPGATVGAAPSSSVSSLPKLEVPPERIEFLDTTGDVLDGHIYALRQMLDENWPPGKEIPIGLDGEWVIDHTERFDLLQLAYRFKPLDDVSVILIPIHRLSSLPPSLEDWLNCPRYRSCDCQAPLKSA